MDDFTQILEGMAANAAQENDPNGTQLEQIERWQHLFDFSAAQAREQIEMHRADIGRLHVSEDLWQIVRAEKESEGFDVEAYEYSLRHMIRKQAPASDRTTNNHPSLSTVYILRLEPPLESALKVQEATGMYQLPEVESGVGQDGTVLFCKINGCERQQLVSWIALKHPSLRPTIVRLSMSPKDLSSISMAPMLGLDTTMPQHRSDTSRSIPLPAQYQYPVWYFFYGNLARSEELQSRLDLPEPAVYTPAHVRGGKIRSWRGQYRALVDSDTNSSVEGSAYLIAGQEQEHRLRFYETEKYEVVRCLIEMEGRIQNGLVFRFAGAEAELQ